MLCGVESFDVFVVKLSKYLGEYIIIYRDSDRFILLNDAAAQHQIFYDTSYAVFGSQPKLLCEIVTPEHHTCPNAIEFYSSIMFQKHKDFIYDTTHLKNVKHLLPNHYIDVLGKSVIRFFPKEPLVIKPIKDVAPQAVKMLKGYIKSIGLRKSIVIPFTAGYDSRVLFLSSLEENCSYFVYKNTTDNRYDITIPKKIAKYYNKDFEVVSLLDTFEDCGDSIDFPRKTKKRGKYFMDSIYLFGTVSEIVRNIYGYRRNVSANELSTLLGYRNFKPAISIIDTWLKETKHLETKGYNILDMFYLDYRLGIWSAKSKTELRAIGLDAISPFNSRDLLIMLLSTPRKDRDYYNNNLFDALLKELSPQSLDFPINPCFSRSLRKLTSKLGIYDSIKWMALKYGLA